MAERTIFNQSGVVIKVDDKKRKITIETSDDSYRHISDVIMTVVRSLR